MLLKDGLIRIGNLFFRLRSWQFLLTILVVVLERDRFRSSGGGLLWDVPAVLVALSGIMLRALTIGFAFKRSSGRNLEIDAAAELNTTGTYSLCRNPLYLGNYLINLGVSLFTRVPEVAVINTLVFIAIYTPIILAEEEFLAGRFGRPYLDWAARVPCFVPSLKVWTPPVRSFSPLFLLRREPDTWNAAAVSFFAVGLLRNWLRGVRPVVEVPWALAMGAFLAAWLVLKALKKAGVFSLDKIAG